MDKREKKTSAGTASRRNFLVGLVAGVGAGAAVLGAAKPAKAQAKSGSVLFRRTAETEKYYKTLTRQ